MPYAVKLYAQGGATWPMRITKQPKHKSSGSMRDEFNRQFGHPDFPRPFDTSRHQVHFLGRVGHGEVGRLAQSEGPHRDGPLAFHPQDHQRRTRPARFGSGRAPASVQEYRFNEEVVADAGGRYKEMWLQACTATSAVQFPDDHQLSDIALSWMVEEARAAGLVVNPKRYKRVLGVGLGEPLPAERALGRIHANGMEWLLAGDGESARCCPDDALHPSVLHRIEQTAHDGKPYRPELGPR